MFNIFDYTQRIRKLFSRRDALILALLIVCFLATRLINLDEFPIFSDEGIYIRWAKVAWKDASWRFISLTDGRQPFQTWATIPLLKLFEHNALFAGRLFAVASGLFALSGLFSLAYYLFGKRAAFITGFLYIFTPYFLFFDRIALADSAVNGFTIWMFLLAIILARTRRLDVALVLGFIAGFGMLTKSSMRLYVALMLSASIFILYEQHEGFLTMIKNLKNKVWGKDHKWREMINFLILYGISVAITTLIYNVQRLSAFFHYVAEKNTTFVLTFAEFREDPFNYFSNNIIDIPFYVFSEMGYVIPLLAICGLVALYKKNKTVALYFMIWLITALISIAFAARVLFPRYVLSLGGLLVVPAAYFISTLDRKYIKNAVIALIAISVIYFDYAILLKPAAIPFPEIDRGQYIEGWPAGWGAKEIMAYAREKSKTKDVVVLAEGNFGMAGDVLDTFLLPEDKIQISGYWPLDEKSLAENQELLKEKDVFVVFSHRDEFPSEWPIELIQKYEKPCDRSKLLPFDKILGQDPATKDCNSALYLFQLKQSLR